MNRTDEFGEHGTSKTVLALPQLVHTDSVIVGDNRFTQNDKPWPRAEEFMGYKGDSNQTTSSSTTEGGNALIVTVDEKLSIVV